MRIALAQVNPTVGAIDRNAAEVAAAWRRAAESGADLVAFPELVLTGYPPGDLVLEPEVVAANLAAMRRLAGEGPAGTVAILGFVDETPGALEDDTRDTSVPGRRGLRNAAAVLADGEIVGIYHKSRLPTYGVFDEARWFTPGREPLVVEVSGVRVGITVCEDLWSDEGPVAAAVAAGAEVIANINASPFHRGKQAERVDRVAGHARRHGVWVAYVNMVGGQDGIVFDGGSLVCRPDGEVAARAARFADDLLVCDLDDGAGDPADDPGPDEVGEVWEALVLGTRDYCVKNGFRSATLGLSGGIDSALTAAVAVEALGGDNVLGVLMPSPFTSDASNEDALALAEKLGMATVTLPITDLMEGFEGALADVFGDRERDVTEENIQARIRGVLLMALSNKLGHVVLATGNKSEAAVGYSTLYGDMVGGFAPILDLPKGLVYAVSERRNAEGEVIPRRTLDRPPSAELAPGQQDDDTLPPYDVLDEIVRLYVEEARGVEAIVAEGFDDDVVREVVSMVDAAEFKRHQAAPFVRISERSFTKDRRMPITNAWRR